jgi:hypothetical protein
LKEALRNVFSRVKAISLEIHQDERGAELFEWVALVMIITVLCVAMLVAVSRDLLSGMGAALLDWVIASVGGKSVSSPQSLNAMGRLVVAGVIIVLGLVIVSRFIGIPWERDLLEKDHKKPDKATTDYGEEEAGRSEEGVNG